MYDIKQTDVSYVFHSSVTFTNGHKSTFQKIEHVQIKKTTNGKYEFKMIGSDEELLNGKEPEEFDAIVLEFGKVLYPISLQVSEDGEFLGINDFENLKEHWLTRGREIVEHYNSDVLIENEYKRYALSLASKETFYNILKYNSFYRLLFWNEDLLKREFVIRDFPACGRQVTFYFNDKNETYTFCDEGSGRILNGHATIQLHRDNDGLLNEIKLTAKVEEQDIGYFTKEISLKRR